MSSETQRPFMQAERYTPDLLRQFLADIEQTDHSLEVWQLVVALGQQVDLPFIDYICASSFADWRRTIFVRTSYESSWLNDYNKDPDLSRWSYFRSHAMDRLTPIAIGLEFLDDFMPLPAARVAVLTDAASRGIRAGFSIPLRHAAPPQSALMTFCGDHSKRVMQAIIGAHGWTLNVAAMAAHQRYMMHFAAEFSERNKVTDKQRDLLVNVGKGLQDKQIAETLGVSISAVRQRMTHLMERTGLRTRADLVALAMSLGLLPDPLNRPTSDEAEILFEMDSDTHATRRRRPA